MKKISLLFILCLLLVVSDCGIKQEDASSADNPNTPPVQDPEPADDSQIKAQALIEEGLPHWYLAAKACFDLDKASECFREAAEYGNTDRTQLFCLI